MTLPLEGKLVVDFSQFLAGPLAGLKLADLGARVIKIERPGSGDLCRHLYLTDTDVGGVNSLFQAINRNKESFCADLKKPEDIAAVKNLLKKADIVLQNFRPGVIERLGLDYETIRQFNPTVIYGSVSGYGTTGPWVNRRAGSVSAVFIWFDMAKWKQRYATDANGVSRRGYVGGECIGSRCVGSVGKKPVHRKRRQSRNQLNGSVD